MDDAWLADFEDLDNQDEDDTPVDDTVMDEDVWSDHDPSESDPNWPGEYAAGNSRRSVVVNIRYDTFPLETTWIIARAETVATSRSETTWVTVDSGVATGHQDPVDSFRQTGLATGTYILQIQDPPSKDGAQHRRSRPRAGARRSGL